MLPFELAVSSKGHSIIECVQFQFQPRHFKVVLCLFVLDSCVSRFTESKFGTILIDGSRYDHKGSNTFLHFMSEPADVTIV